MIEIPNTIAIISVIANFIFLAENASLWRIRTTIKTLLKATTKIGPNNWLINLQWTTDNRWRWINPVLDKDDPKKMWIDNEKKKSVEIKKGTVKPGPDHIEYVVTTDDCTSTIDLDEKTASKVGSTPAYVAAQNDLAYSDGFQDGFRRSNNWGLLDSLHQNWQIVVVVGMLLLIGGLVFYERIFTSPACYSQLQNEIAEKNRVMGECSPYVDFNKEKATTTTIPQLSGTGSGVK